MDAFAVAVATGLTVAPITRRRIFRLSFHFGLFQFLMPVIGWHVGRELISLIEGFDHWLAFLLLSFIGGRMIWEAVHENEDDRRQRSDPTRGVLLITLSAATSIDALAAGLSFAFLDESIWVLSTTIGVITAILTAVGMIFGSRIGSRWGTRAEIVGGTVLILIGIRILAADLYAFP
jgi:putative Mn2+ efflux pump MntP